MTSVRDQLADAIGGQESDGNGWCDDNADREKPWRYHVADVLLALPDLAIVRLPNLNVWNVAELTFGSKPMTPELAREIAAGLLASANAAEQETK